MGVNWGTPEAPRNRQHWGCAPYWFGFLASVLSDHIAGHLNGSEASDALTLARNCMARRPPDDDPESEALGRRPDQDPR